MRVYEIHLRPGAGEGEVPPEIRISPSGLSVGCLLLGPLWLVWRDCPGAAVAWLGVMLAAAQVPELFPGVPNFPVIAAVAFHLLFALCAEDFRRRSLRRQGFFLWNILAEDSRAQLERRLARELVRHSL